MTAMVTPFSANGEIDWEGVSKLVDHLVSTGTDTIVVAGTTGESPTLTAEEKIALIKLVKEHAAGRAQVLAGTGTNNTKDTIVNSHAAREAGADGLMVVTPYYNKPPQNSLYSHFLTVAKEVDLPILIYNVPGRTACNMLPDTVCQLSEIDSFLGIKEASGNLDQVSDIARRVREDFLIYSGDDSLTLPMMAVGATGVVSVASHLVGQEIKQMIESFLDGKVDEARHMHHVLFPLFRALFISSNPIPLKWALSTTGLLTNQLRSPLHPLGNTEQEILGTVLRDLGKL